MTSPILPTQNKQFLAPSKPTGAKTLKGKSGDNAGSDYLKFLIVGPPGRGKTRALKDLLLRNLKVCFLSTDVGGSGINAIKIPLRTENPEALANLKEYEFQAETSYEEMAMFLENPNVLTFEDGTNFSDFNPDVLVWDGFSNFQNNHLIQYILENTEGGKNAIDARKEALRAELTDWDSIKRASINRLDKFLSIRGKDGKPIHKYVTCHEDEPRENKTTNEEKRSAMLSGSVRKNFTAAFDLVIFMEKKDLGKDKVEYSYFTESPRYDTKKRGFVLPERMDADFGKLWDEVIKQMRGSN